ncbi:hypothetical protein [Salinilacihabitans rarus]|uniref:hypothetical protein n=1 Tax=Salinilacihabitans rarus TaxID=2961596 RepID=UPI0020C8CC35|nr:hypothetical protein [Salinilacihabitans rarus]
MLEEAALRREFTGMVVASLAVEPDVVGGTVTCTACAREEGDEPTVLEAGDPVVAAATCYEGHSWEFADVRCPRHAVERVAETMSVRAEEQVVLEAVLEPTGYHSPDGEFYPDALTLGAVEVVDYSPTADGY